MILVNRNFGNPILSSVIGDMFKGSSNTGMNVDWVYNTEALASGSVLVSNLVNATASGNIVGSSQVASYAAVANQYTTYQPYCQNFYIVTEQFLKTLDKVYTKIWNESFTETGIYVPSNLATLYSGFVSNTSDGATGPFMMFKKFVDRAIAAGILVEADRLQYEDQIFLSGMSRANMSTQIDLDNKLVTLTNSTPINITPDINAMEGQYLYGKKLFLLMTPYLTNESVIKGQTETSGTLVTQEPFWNTRYLKYDTDPLGVNGNTGDQHFDITTPFNTPVRRPLAFFKPKTDASKFGRSLPLATHLIWSIGTPADKEIALIEGKPVPDLIFDHLDRISYIDSLVLKIKFDKLQF